MSTKTFEGVTDRYNGITVDSCDENFELDKFSAQLIGDYDYINIKLFHL